MQKQITIDFDQQTFELAKSYAKEKGLSLNEIIKTYIQKLVWKKNLQAANILEKKEIAKEEKSFYELINQYNSINEPDLEINTIFNEREQQNNWVSSK